MSHWWEGERGEGYLVMKGVLLALVFGGPAISGPRPPWSDTTPVRRAGFALLLFGLALAAAAIAKLRRVRFGKDPSGLVTTGIFRLVRHPIYGAMILIAFGYWLALGAWLTLAAALVLVVVLHGNAAQEERELGDRFVEYANYKHRTRRFLPFLY